MSLLIEALIKKELITEEQLRDAEDKKMGAKKPVQELLVEMGFLSEDDLIKCSSEVFDMPILDLGKEKIDGSVIKIIPYEIAKRCGVFPLRQEEGTLILAMSNPQDIMALDDIRALAKSKVKPVLGRKGQIAEFTDKYYQSDDSLYDILKNIGDDVNIDVIREMSSERMKYYGGIQLESAPVVRLLNVLLSDAVSSKASDIHLEPQGGFTEVRYRIDGDLRKIMKIPANLQAPLVSRVKILAELDIAEKRKTQDGRIRISAGSRSIDIRISILPTFYGEKVVMRLLDIKEAKVDLNTIGFEEKELDVFKKELNKAQGIILVTGPTGSGKTSTLYSALNFIKDETKNIVTIEDPVEYLIEGINQIPVNPVKDITFSKGLKSILRQDPDIILVGEIRDQETAEIALRSSLTGHLVLSTLHTNNAVATITRLLDIGLESYLISSAVNLIVAQRLVKLICPYCKTKNTPSEELLGKFRIYIDKYNIKEFYKGTGCDKCNFTGTLGRTAIFEIVEVNDKIKKLISDEIREDEIFKNAKEGGMITLAESGVRLAAKGRVSLEEVSKTVDVIEETPQEGKEDSGSPVEEEIQGKIKILIADDEAITRTIVQKHLQSAGYDVIQAINGKKAVEAANREKPDLIVMDLKMPEMNGFEATEKLRSKLETAIIPIIMLTAETDKESELKGFDIGADDYVTKPFDKEKLLARIKMLLKRSRR